MVFHQSSKFATVTPGRFATIIGQSIISFLWKRNRSWLTKISNRRRSSSLGH